MKKDKKTGGTDKRYVSSLEKKIETWVAKSGLAVLKGTAKSIKEAYALMKDPEYMLFSEQIGKTKHLALTDVGYLMPCKQRRMARFMNLYPIIDWADSMLAISICLAKKKNTTTRLYRATPDSSRNSARCLHCLRTSCRFSRARGCRKKRLQGVRPPYQGTCFLAVKELAG